MPVDTAAAQPFDNALCGRVAAAGASYVVSWLGWDSRTFRFVVFARRFAAALP